MTQARPQLINIIHAVARRAIRHDAKLPLDHVQTYCGFTREALAKRKSLTSKIVRPTDVLLAVSSLPKLADGIDRKITSIEKSLGAGKSYGGDDARRDLQALRDGDCREMERISAFLKRSFEGVDQEVYEFSIRIQRNASLASQRIQSLLTFFRDDFSADFTNEIDLQNEAERAARDASPNSNTFSEVFSFGGTSPKITGNRSLIQSVLQNIYQNTIRYGSGKKELSSVTTFVVGHFANISTVMSELRVSPASDSLWVRADFMNNGPPISVGNPNAIFKLGKRFSVDGISGDSGQGLGMAICFAAAVLHRGTISADRRRDGVCIRLLLPMKPAAGFSDDALQTIATQLDVV